MFGRFKKIKTKKKERERERHPVKMANQVDRDVGESRNAGDGGHLPASLRYMFRFG